MTYRDFFLGKKVTVMGLGLLGRGVGDVEFIAPLAKEILVTDKKTEEELKESVERLKKFPNVSFRLGEHREADFTSCDMVIKAAGVPLDSPYIAAARAANIPVYMSTALFAKFTMEIGATVVGVTGTRGKSTVANMIYYSLIQTNMRTFLGGNVRSVSTLALLPEVKRGNVMILELDSWQLQGFGDLKISPRVAIFANLYPDHQNYYLSMDAYFADKANIFRNQRTGDILLVGVQVADLVRGSHPPVAPMVPPPLPREWELAIPGEHNRSNAAFAAEALRSLGLSDAKIRLGLESFKGLEGRLQYIGDARGIKVYNDNNATTPEATIAALRALGTDARNIVLIVGGDDKRLDMSKLMEEIPKWCKGIILFKEKGTDTIRDRVFEMKDIEAYEEEGLEATVDRAFAIAKSGDTILYSPAFSSFGKYFKNEFDRGDQFMRLAKERGVHP